jgi:mono/diheme cytochrome c family protein
MSDENKSCQNSSNSEPVSPRSAAPMWIIVLTLILLFVGGYYLDQRSGWFNPNVYAPYHSAQQLEGFQPQSGEAAALARGKVVYESVCGICHGTDGAGKPGQAPQLAGSEWVVTKGPSRLIHIAQLGVMGPITVAGKEWNMAMAGMGATLPDEDLAAVLTYVRTSWGNKAEAITPEDIKKIRAEIGKSAAPVTQEKLLQMPE